MPAVETGQMSAAETGHRCLSAVETGQMSAVETKPLSKDSHNYPQTLKILKTHKILLSATRS